MVNHFYSDPHFGHYNIIDYALRPYRTSDEMDDALVANYNAVVDPNDVVCWLGDCALGSVEKAKATMGRLNGRRILVLGNHDRTAGVMAGLGFELVMREAVIRISGRTCRLHHYPYAPPRNNSREKRQQHRHPVRRKGEVLIHGHTHTNDKAHDGMIHVGVDAWDYRPVPYEAVAELVRSV